MSRVIPVLLSLVLLTGCLSSAIGERTSNNYTLAGAVAQKQGNWDAARRAYARAVVNAEQANLAASRRSVLNYEYGRSLGVTCFFSEAERELLISYDLDKQSGAPLYLSLTELARLNYDQKKYQTAANYYERSIAELDKANGATSAPIAYADILDEYSVSLKESGEEQKSIAAALKAKEIRSKYPQKRSITDRTPYGTQCTKKN